MNYIQAIRQSSIKSVQQVFTLIKAKLRRHQLLPAEGETMPKEEIKPEALQPAYAELSDEKGQSYFVESKSWADDMYTSVVISRNRYKLAFLVSMGLTISLAIAINGLIPMQHMEPLLVNHYQDGRVVVQPIRQDEAPANQAQVESDIVRYVINRESYDATSYDVQYSLIHLLSNSTVSRQYNESQSSINKRSPINVLGNQGYRTVHVDNVIFLDNEANNQGKQKSNKNSHNLAEVNFTITDHAKNSGRTRSKSLTALISWGYRGQPENPADVWRNWNGFTVTRYTVQQRNI